MTDPPAPAARVAFAGENPLIMLYRPGGEGLVAVASLWHARYTEHGSGTSLLIWADPAVGQSGESAESGESDVASPTASTPTTCRWLGTCGTPSTDAGTLLGHGLETTEPQPAQFAQVRSARVHRTTCITGNRLIELEWRDPGRAIWTETFPYEYRTTAVIVPCPAAAILVDGRPVPGEVRPHHDEFVSSAALAFCETWMTAPSSPDGRPDLALTWGRHVPAQAEREPSSAGVTKR